MFMTLWLFTKLNSLIPLLYLDSSIQSPFKSLINLKDFPRSLNRESGRASHLVYKFYKNFEVQQFQIKILNLFGFPHVLAAQTSKSTLQMTY